jgi:small subunit ribosomal protein S17
LVGSELPGFFASLRMTSWFFGALGIMQKKRQIIHPFYKRVVRHSRTFLAHDEKNECRQGDRVRIQETRPLSRQKRWRVVEIVHKAVQVAPLPEATV